MKIVVFNNGALGFVELEQKSSGFLYSGTDLVNPNFAALAEAVGIKGVRIANPAEVEPKLHEAFAHPGPVLVDAVVNRMELAMSPRVTAEMAKGFTLYLLKAVMSGRGPTKSSNWPEPTCGVERLRSRFTVTVDYLSLPER